jgi:two-component system CheB/CheR fusion protein
VDTERLRTLLWGQAPDHAFLLLDSSSNIVAWQGAAADMFGYAEAEVLGKPLDFLFTEQDCLLGMPQHEREVAVSAGRSEDDRWHLRKDGALIWVFGSLIALKEHGQLVGFAKVVSERTNKRAQIETLQNRLEGAKRQLEARDVFFGRLTHEVRNSLAPIMNVANLLEKADALDRNRLPLVILKRQVGQLERMMRDLTDVARFGAGKLQLFKQDFDLGADLAEITEAIRSQASAKRQELVVIVPSAPVLICADRQRVHQIVFNLLHNAIKYTPEDGQIWAQCTVEAEHGVIKIEDTGVGIAPELLPVIFDLFTQENPDRSEGGFGVGLSLVKDLVDAHHGFVEVRCDGKGKGAVFSVRLPLRDKPTREAA